MHSNKSNFAERHYKVIAHPFLGIFEKVLWQKNCSARDSLKKTT